MIMKSSLNKPFKATPVFARHETFHPRFGWLKKGFDKASENNGVFLDEMAPVALGVGKNMVKAIRYWCLAYKVLEDVQEKGQGRRLVPTEFGNKLLGNDGWDPYLEDHASLWLLHWNLLKLPILATAWYYTFNVFNKHVFMAEDMQHGLQEYKKREFPNYRITESSLVKDISCILRMYVDQTNQKMLNEDSIDSPFTEIGLIKNYGDTRHFAMNIGPKVGLTPEIIASACLDYAAKIEEGAKTISISRLTYDMGSPGQCFKLTENLIGEAIEFVSSKVDELDLSETAGIVQLSFTEDPLLLCEIILNSYYGKRRN